MSRLTARWLVGTFVGLLLVVASLAVVAMRTNALRRLFVQTLAERMDSRVELESFDVRFLPTVRVTGAKLVLRHKGRTDVPPLVAIRSFSIDGDILGVLVPPHHFRAVTLTGLEISVPPGWKEQKEGAPQPGTARPATAPITVDRLESEDASLTLIPRQAGKTPRVFLIHHLTMTSVGLGQAMPFEAALTNPQPRGIIETRGTFGPWQADEPGGTPVAGAFTFDKADLSTVNGIGGTLHASGNFAGHLGRISVTGETHTPDFRLNVSGNTVPLDTTFEAVVDGTDGDTYLNAVSARLLETPLFVQGAIVGLDGKRGHEVKVHVKVERGRIEDLLRLAVKGGRPLMSGRVDVHADLHLLPGKVDVIDRLGLGGEFGVRAARFADPATASRIASMSERASGRDPEGAPDSVASNVRGHFRLAGGVLTLSEASFEIPGAKVQMAGTYGLRDETLSFDGTLRMDATVSQAAGGGAKSVFLKLVDPLFRKGGAGAVLPIKVRGTRDQPAFGLDVRKALTSR